MPGEKTVRVSDELHTALYEDKAKEETYEDVIWRWKRTAEVEA